MDVKQPFAKKIANLSKEPVAYHLYKARHFENKKFFQDTGGNADGDNNLRGLNC